MNKMIPIGLGAILLLASASTAQVEASAPTKAQDYKALVASFEKAKADYDAKVKAIMNSDEYKRLRKERNYDALRKLHSKLVHPNAEFYKRFEALSKTQVGTPAEVETLLWMLSHNRDKAKNAATIEALAKRHIKGDFWGPQLRLVTYYLGTEKGAAILERLIKENEDLSIQLGARYALANGVIRSKTATEEEKAAARADLDDIVAKHPDSIPALNIKAPEFIKTRLQIGMEAPDIIGKDVDGNDIKLSDYRGRVVVLDFWGDW